jgi:hypothetical protein
MDGGKVRVREKFSKCACLLPSPDLTLGVIFKYPATNVRSFLVKREGHVQVADCNTHHD